MIFSGTDRLRQRSGRYLTQQQPHLGHVSHDLQRSFRKLMPFLSQHSIKASVDMRNVAAIICGAPMTGGEGRATPEIGLSGIMTISSFWLSLVFLIEIVAENRPNFQLCCSVRESFPMIKTP